MHLNIQRVLCQATTNNQTFYNMPFFFQSTDDVFCTTLKIKIDLTNNNNK